MGVISDVTQHVDHIDTARFLLRLSEADHPTDLYLALMHIESLGQELPNETDSYRHWFQIGQAYMDDARIQAERRHPDVVHRLPMRLDDLNEAGPVVSAMITMLYMERWHAYHGYDPYRMAGMHKGGIGSAKQVARKVRAGVPVEAAHYWVATQWIRKSTGRPWVPRLYLYVYGKEALGEQVSGYRFAQAFRDYSTWCDAHAPSSIRPDAERGLVTQEFGEPGDPLTHPQPLLPTPSLWSTLFKSLARSILDRRQVGGDS